MHPQFYAFENLETVIGRPIETINMVGGGIKDKMLCQFTAEGTNRKVITGPVEATAMGNLLMQAYALGEIKSLEELRDVVKKSTELDVYMPDNREEWDKAYDKFLEIIK